MKKGLDVGETITGRVETVAFGGDGIVRHEGQVVFVPLTTPGDEVVVEITKARRQFVHGTVREVVVSGPDRVDPLCPHYEKCGGCQLQHLSASAQAEYKKQAVIDTLQRIGKVRIPENFQIIPATQIWHYRRSVKLTLQPGFRGYDIGYVRRDLKGVVPITECLIFTEEDDLLFQELYSFSQQLPQQGNVPPTLSVVKAEKAEETEETKEKVMLHLSWPGQRPKEVDQLAGELVAGSERIQGILVTDEKSKSVEFGEIRGRFVVDGLEVRHHVRSFVQNHPHQSLELYRYVREVVAKAAPERLLDLYSGLGITSMLFARDGATVESVEGSPYAVADAEHNIAVNGIEGVTPICADVSEVIEEVLGRVAPQTVFLNPPRVGIHDDVVAALARAKPRQIVYVSCMPSTLARDLAVLTKVGYQLSECRAYDLFPQTSHVETVAVLEMG